jgi:hypothetical protein
MRCRLLLSIAAMASAVLIALVSLSTVDADPYPGTNLGFLTFPDPGPHQACWAPDPNTTTIPAAIWNHLFAYMDTTLRSQTGISVAWTTSCGNNLVDMRLDDRLADPNLYGLQQCVSVQRGLCLGSDVFVNLTTIYRDAANAGMNGALFEQASWCHETGHTLGLGHETGCLLTGVNTSTTYSPHHVTHIDTRF